MQAEPTKAMPLLRDFFPLANLIFKFRFIDVYFQTNQRQGLVIDFYVFFSLHNLEVCDKNPASIGSIN